MTEFAALTNEEYREAKLVKIIPSPVESAAE